MNFNDEINNLYLMNYFRITKYPTKCSHKSVHKELKCVQQIFENFNGS